MTQNEQQWVLFRVVKGIKEYYVGPFDNYSVDRSKAHIYSDRGKSFTNLTRLPEEEWEPLIMNALAKLIEAAKDCAINRDMPDICGVCGLHFADCDAERAMYVDDFEEGRHNNTFPSCAGGRMRIVLEKYQLTR